MAESGEIQPRWNFIIIDPKEKTRTTCYVTTKSCRINAFRRDAYAESEKTEDAPWASTMESVSLGTSVMETLTVEGIRETTFVAAGAYGNSKPLIITRELWHSPELDLHISITKTDPRSGQFTRKIEILSRTEPDPQYFSIPGDYTFLDNRPDGEKIRPDTATVGLKTAAFLTLTISLSKADDYSVCGCCVLPWVSALATCSCEGGRVAIGMAYTPQRSRNEKV
jgi:hypothetical protein